MKIKNPPTSWNLTPLFTGDNDPEIKKSRDQVKKNVYRFINKWKKRSDYLIKPRVLKEALNEYEKLITEHGLDGKEGYYFSLRSYLEQDNPKLKAKLNKIIEFSQQASIDMQFFTLNLSRVTKEHQKKFLSSELLSDYHYFLKRLFDEANYLLSDEAEKVMTLKSKPAYGDWVRLTGEFLSKQVRVVKTPGGAVSKTFNEILSLMDHTNKKTRDDAARVLNEILADYIEVGEAEMNAILENHRNDNKLRGLPRPDSAMHLSDDVPSEVVDTLVSVVKKQYNLTKRYYQLKAKLFKVKKLEYHERNLEFEDIEKKYSYEDSVVLVSKVFSRLDSEFVDIFNTFVKNGQVDVFPRKGKAGGAFCAYDVKSHPVFVLLNHTDKLVDVATLAHEFGHAINDELMRKKQHGLYFSTPLATAEVASTFFEDFVFDELLRDANEEERLSLLMSKLNDELSTTIRQIAFYDFETELHAMHNNTGFLSHKDIGALFQKHMRAYMGSGVEQSKGSQNWWLYVSHFRRFFYVYSYAGGLLISKALQRQVKADSTRIEKFKEFLSAGASDSPVNIFNTVDIDITKQAFWKEGLKEIEDLLDETESLAKRLKKI